MTSPLLLFSFLLLCFAPPPFSSYARKNRAEIKALVSFKVNLNDPLQWLDGWNPATPSAPCDWRGISCAGRRKRVAQIRLSSLQFSGPLSENLSELKYLHTLILASNAFNGTIPPSLSKCKRLKYLMLQNNSFSGHLIPANLQRLSNLSVLNLANNNLSGDLPPLLFKLPNIEFINLRENSLSGQIPTNLSRLLRLQVLDLGRNNLSGGIPEGISECLSLTSLSLDGNRLSGRIPDLARTTNLEYLDLAANNLSGEIPDNFTRISRLGYFNVSRNNLEGEIPVLLGLRFNDPSVFSGNSRLCGKPLEVKCGDPGAPGGDQGKPSEENIAATERRKRAVILIVVGVSSACILALYLCFCVPCFLRWRNGIRKCSSSRGNGEPKLVMFNIKNFTLDGTIEATGRFNEENVLMRTSYAIVFKASFKCGMILSIYSLLDESVDEEAFGKEAECLGKLKHRNLAVLRGYYAGPPSLRLLVYDYMPNGNLDTLLQEAWHRNILNWPMCHLIALGIAKGLAFLHSSNMIHGDVKLQSVLLDADFEAHLSDFGLQRLVTPTETSSSSKTPFVGTVGYVPPPDKGLRRKVTKESDVYRYGIVLLELLTGKRSLSFSRGDKDLVKSVNEQLRRGEMAELAGPCLNDLVPESSPEEWEEFLLAVKVGLFCTATDPLERPTMSDVVFMLESCSRKSPIVPSSKVLSSQHSPAAPISDSFSSSESFWIIP